MKRFYISSLILSIVLALHFAAKSPQRPLENARLSYLENINSFQSHLALFRADLRAYRQGNLKPAELQDSFAQLRLAFKRVEFMLDYLEPQDVKDHINGAPLAKTERNAPRLVIIEPKGLQRIEEWVYEDYSEEQVSELIKLSKELESQFKVIALFAKKSRFTDRQVFEAARMGLVRITSLGITGFDTPSSNKAISESLEAWKAIQTTLEPYWILAGNKNLASEMEKKFKGGANYLASNLDFDSFNRLNFIRNYVEPLYRQSLDLHRELAFEMAGEVFRGELAFNYEASSIFSADFFNLKYYTGLKEDSLLPIKRELGRLLFFDPVLSANFQRSCASCHDPQKAFSDGQAKSLAFDKKGQVERNAPGLFNALYAEKFFHDLRADRMETQMEHVIFSEKEFATNYKTIFKRLKSSEEYLGLFKKAFPGFKEVINRHTLSQSIIAYLSELQSFNSPVDQYLRGESNILEPKVKAGFNLFMGKAACATCHFAPSWAGLVPPLFEENESEVLGVLKAPGLKELDSDRGRIAGGVVQDEAPFFENSFKTPTIRNVALTAPYFHNGAYPDLKSVLEFYNHGGALGLGMGLDHQTLPGDSLELSGIEINQLESFLRALTDTGQGFKAPSSLPELSAEFPKNRLSKSIY